MTAKPHPCQDYLEPIQGCYWKGNQIHVCTVCRDCWTEIERTVRGDGGDADVMTMVRLSEVMEDEG